ncbi:hypothetical protein [Vreelandella titanicae]|uniref:DegT/DnrJ/EryC1/StrS aminotransferase family protein n=1 Tax=Vreelandella titanicae TaxID=664683 RepID=A0A558JDB1_9GAMM|nr:hypothetical protein [Halomonas titanicae]TVU91621.1 hypothetical protein FQP89_00365 [Halomonas titanicae]
MMGFIKDSAIGGYQGLELPVYDANFAQGVIKTNSARSAIKLVLSSIEAKKVWLPAYTCDAVVEAASDIGVTVEFYKVDSSFDVDPGLQFKEDEFILIVDFFGLCGEVVQRSKSRFDHRQMIVDCSQAYFAEPAGSLATIYSPRKFFGLPDGGLLYSNDTRIKQPEQRDNTSGSRVAHLINRLTNSPEEAYQQYLEAEQAISNLPAQGMSCLTERLLQSVDYERARTARAKNALYLHERLSQYNQLNLKIDESAAPLCYPFLTNVKTASKPELISQRVFVPTYWPEVLNRVEEGSFEWNLVTNGLFLPCDQRYNEDDMDRLISLLAIK